MTAFNVPEPFEVTHITRVPDGKSPAGQIKYRDVPRPRRVRAFDQPSAQEIQSAQMAGRTITDLEMADDEGDWPADSVVELWDGRRFEVNGEPRDENLGPYGFKPGYVIPLRRVVDN